MQKLNKVNLGCPNLCDGYVCVDLKPKDERVICDEAYSFLHKTLSNEYDEIKAFNLIEHLENIGQFFYECTITLKPGGKLIIRTDNAEFFPFYLPIIKRFGFSAHKTLDYNPKIMNGSKHYSVFTTLHLRNFADRYDLKIESIRRVNFGSRLLAVFVKPFFD